MCAKTVYHYNEEMDKYLISPGSIDEQLNFHQLFEKDQPVEVEIGTGKGRFILSESKQRSDTNFLGIERSKKFLRIALDRMTKDPRPNCLFLCLDADFVVKLLIPERSITAYHIYFPDPWPKERHQKRRLFNPGFVDKLAKTLTPDGKIYLKTDHQEFFSYAHQQLSNNTNIKTIELDTIESIIKNFEEAPVTATHYEVKFRQQSKPIFTSIYALA